MRPGQKLRDWLRQERDHERVRLHAQSLLETFPGTSQGRALPASPIAREGGPSVPAVTIRRGGPAGELIHLSATADSIASGGDYLTATAAQHQHGFEATTTGTDVTIPRTGNYDISLVASWDSFLLGGKVEWELNGAVLPWGLDAGGLGDGFTWADTFYAEKGDTLKVKVTQTSGSAQALTWDLTVSVQEPRRQIASPAWTKVASVDAWGIFFDGTYWWITEGDSGETLSQYDSSWTLVDTFEIDMQSNILRGVTDAANSTDLWLSGDDPQNISGSDFVHRHLKSDGSHITDFQVTDGAVNGIAYDGTDLWIIGNVNNELRRYSTTGTLQETIALPGDRQGLAIYGGNLVLVNGAASEIEVRNTSGTLLQTIGAYEIDGPTGVWVAADGTLYASKDGDGVYKWNEGTL